MEAELKRIAIKLMFTLLATPLMGWVLLKNVDWLKKAWNSNNRRKQWMVMCVVFFFLAILGGWLQ